MSPQLYSDAFQALQRAFEVERLTFHGVNWWMAVRLLMLGRFSGEAHRRALELFGVPSHSAVLFSDTAGVERVPWTPADPVAVGRSALLFPPADRARIDDAASIFFELPVDYAAVMDGAAVDRIADGFAEAFGSSVTKVCRFSPAVARANLKHPTTLVHLAPHPIAFGGVEGRRFRAATGDLCAALERVAPDITISQAELLQSVAVMLRTAAAHEAWIRATGARVMFVQSFPSFEKMAALLGARAAGVRTVDVQHGYTDANSIHNALPVLSDGSRHVYPDVMWCWGEATRSALAADPSLAATGVEPLLGGDVWGALRDVEVEAQTAVLRERLEAGRYTRRVLVGQQIETLSLAGGSRGYLPEIIHQAMTDAPRDWLWMVRLHPRSMHLLDRVRSYLRDSGLENVEVEHSSRSPIEVVMSVADVYATSFSVSAFEANALNRPVLLFDDVGAALFHQEVACGAFATVRSADDLLMAAARAEPPAVRLDYYRRDLGVSRAAFESLLRAPPLVASATVVQEEA